MTVLERPNVLPEPFTRWFASRGWTPRAHQLELLAKAEAGRSVLLIAPTGGGKTLAGFLPSLVELSGAQSRSSPLARSAPSPLVGEGGGRGSRGDASCVHARARPPDPHPRPLPTRGRGGASDAPSLNLHRPRHPPRGRTAHALHFAAQGARRRYRAQSGNADCRDGAADPHRDAHRRYAELKTPAPAPRSAGDFADHAGAAGAAAGLRRRAVFVRFAQARDPR